MSTYKVLQDIEAEDKLVGPLSLRQFIFAGIAALCFYVSFLAFTKGVGFLAVVFIPVGLFAGFFAFPWGGDQPTEIWALAKIRFFLKPRKRVWDQSGVKELVTVTVPKHIEHDLTNGLSEHEVNSRLHALANTIDSRGWAVKNVNISMYNPAAIATDTSDRLVGPTVLPQEVSNIDVRASDDMLDAEANPIAQHFENMLDASSQSHRQQLIAQMQQPADNTQPASSGSGPQTPNDYWFLNQPAPVAGQATFADASIVSPGSDLPVTAPHAATPTADEEALVEQLKAENARQHEVPAYGHMKLLQPTPGQAVGPAVKQQNFSSATQPKPPVTADTQAAIINLAQNDDLNVATIARQAHKQTEGDGNSGEVVISLH
jgi:hypothetical protein